MTLLRANLETRILMRQTRQKSEPVFTAVKANGPIDQMQILFDLLGHPVHASVRCLVAALRTKTVLMFLALVYLLLFATDPPRLHSYLPLWQAALVWPISLSIYISTYLMVLVATGGLRLRFPNFRVYLPVVGTLALLPTIGISELIIYSLAESEYPINFIYQYIFFLITAQVFETVFYRFVLPAVPNRDETIAPPPASPQPERSIFIGDTALAPSRLRHISANEHILHITLDTGSLHHRARLSDVVAQTTAEDGIQPHRSWWVSRAAQARLCRESQRPKLVLEDGTEIPVARGRLNDVERWIKTNTA